MRTYLKIRLTINLFLQKLIIVIGILSLVSVALLIAVCVLAAKVNNRC
jgi:hypothetical protein